MLKEIIEDISFKFINFTKRLNSFNEYKIEWNNKIEHNILIRIKERTNLTPNELIEKIKLGLEYLLNENKEGIICLTFTKSKFILIVKINNSNKTIKIITILSDSMNTSHCIKMDIDEVYFLRDILPKDISLNEVYNITIPLNEYMLIEENEFFIYDSLFINL